MAEEGQEEQRIQYANKCELMLSLVGYAVGLGNIWRFPYLVYTYGGGAFLIPYAIALSFLGLPLFILELGLGQMLRQGTLGIWVKLGLSRLRGIGASATICTFLVSLYYNVILSWTIYYLGSTIAGIFNGGILPWDDQVPGFECAETVLIVNSTVAGAADLIHSETRLFNEAYASDFWCPDEGLPKLSTEVPAGYERLVVRPTACPAAAAVKFWERSALQQTSGMDELGGFQPGMVISYTVAWILVYFCICQGVASSGKVVYVTATLPYVALCIFFVRAITLTNAAQGVYFFVMPDFTLLMDGEVWIRAVVQIYFSLGVGFGSLIAFGSYGAKKYDFAGNAAKVALINCGTSIFAGFVVFPILGFLASELSHVNPCIRSDNLSDLSSIGLSGTGLAFIAFPIAISQMPGSFFWALLFFLMLLCLGIDSQFAMCESVLTVLHDAGAVEQLEKAVGRKIPRPMFAAAFCVIMYAIGLVFVTRGGIYWFQTFDYYTCVVAMFFVTLVECVGLMYSHIQCQSQPPFLENDIWPKFRRRVKDWTGRNFNVFYMISWRFVCPVLLLFLLVLSCLTFDLMDAAESVPYPEGTGYYPPWSVWFGWALGLVPVAAFFPFTFFAIKDGEAGTLSLLTQPADLEKKATRNAPLEPDSKASEPGITVDDVFLEEEPAGANPFTDKGEEPKLQAGNCNSEPLPVLFSENSAPPGKAEAARIAMPAATTAKAEKQSISANGKHELKLHCLGEICCEMTCK